MKDDPHEVAMSGPKPKASIPTIASVFVAAMVLGFILLVMPQRGFLSETSPHPAQTDER